MSIYIGLDLATQSLKAVVIEVGAQERRVVFRHRLGFDEDFPSYGTREGVLPNEDPGSPERFSSPQMWAEALDRMMEVLAREGGFALEEVRAISGSGQQHGSVYLNAEATGTLAALDPARPLVEQMEGMFVRRRAPIWMDSSTTEQCEEITEAIGGEGILANLTGSRAIERFTGPQIRKFYQEDPEGYERTDRIHLVSSYAASLLAGKHAAIDPADGSGMNLMDLARKRWAASALQVTSPELDKKLIEIQSSWTVLGPLSNYWVQRHGFSENTKAVIWSGDNPCSLIGVGIVESGRVAISLGTSDTFFGAMLKPKVDPAGYGHTFGSPTGDYMSLICFKNGSLAREQVRDQYGMDWEAFSSAFRKTPPGNQGRILLPWFEEEITPKVLDAAACRYELAADDAPANVRAVIEGQMMSMALHSHWMGVQTSAIHATGGASANRDVLQVMADVHGADVFQLSVEDSAALGAALRAFHADEVAEGKRPSWQEVVHEFAEPLSESRVSPDPKRVALYEDLKEVYRACEDHALRGGDDPRPVIQAFRKKHRRK
jgi:xylulokinase